jgi:hypothetical protein
VFAQPVRRRNALGLQTLPDIAQVADLDAKMVDNAATSLFGNLIVDVETTSPYGEENVSRASQFIVEENLCTHMLAPPCDGRLDIACKQMSMMEIERHGSLPVN